MLLWIMFYFVLVRSDHEVHRPKKEYLVQIKKEWFESVKFQSEKFGLKFLKKIVSNIYLFEAENITGRPNAIEEFKTTFAGKVLEVELREYSKPSFDPWLKDSPAPQGFLQRVLTKRSDPKIQKTWPYYGMNIQEAWSMGLTGEGIVIAVVDSGVELDHKDLKRNINRNKSKSFAEDDTEHGEAKRLVSYQETDFYTSHGTKVAGLIAAGFGNGVCSAGVAFNATLISLKVFKVDERQIFPPGITFPDDHISQALEYDRSEIDIYSCSFGLDNMFSKSTKHIRNVLREGVTQGRNGKGSIYVFAAGNLGSVYDCNTVPYANSIYTITIASVGKGGKKPHYAMPCSSVLAATYGEYSTYNGSRKLKTTTLDGKCDEFMGTSASTAVASGIIALMLQANKDLTWRDVQHIIVRSASFERLETHNRTTENGNGLFYNPYFGFGIMNATGAILLARNWTTVSAQKSFTVVSKPSSVKNVFITTVNFPRSYCPQYIEHVRVLIVYSIEARKEKHLQISLRSPAGTRSVLLNSNVIEIPENNRSINRKWNFTSVQFWGETSYGDWTLRIRVVGLKFNLPIGSVLNATFTFFGTATKPYTGDCYHHCSTVEDKHSNEVECTTKAEIVYIEKQSLGDTHEAVNPYMNIMLIVNGVVIIICVLVGGCMYKSGNLPNCYETLPTKD